MGRWKPNARGRLELSALELFVERGYESTTVAEIAERAGLAKSTFFRHFSDKREVLFGGGDTLGRLFAEAIGGAPEATTPIGAVGAALDAAAVGFPEERRPWVRQRQVVIAGNSDLRERELLKRATLTAAMAEALRERGVPDRTASLGAEMGTLAFQNALDRWADPADQPDFAGIVRQELAALRAATAALG
ncbi:TetR family transcriptional regulator [Streptomyces sp. 150FB]|uniref:TetR/AcrR family transcriptional regulator n=1 Tax=Streptomyces sp. 150FB TaxID=1576605 RepID=UPI000588F704|nr:TetR/AcrR family transcriptional regulator [Streptomyces sp. 150FB]KIF75322.1 TetR family transcriptional regulator [Streptomyces sp. 150FB]